MWPGVLDAAEAGDANLVCFPGGRLYAQDNFEAGRNLIYNFINSDLLDGLVSWTSVLAGNMPPEDIAQYLGRYEPLPIVSLAAPV